MKICFRVPEHSPGMCAYCYRLIISAAVCWGKRCVVYVWWPSGCVGEEWGGGMYVCSCLYKTIAKRWVLRPISPCLSHRVHCLLQGGRETNAYCYSDSVMLTEFGGPSKCVWPCTRRVRDRVQHWTHIAHVSMWCVQFANYWACLAWYLKPPICNRPWLIGHFKYCLSHAIAHCLINRFNVSKYPTSNTRITLTQLH